MSNAYRFVRVDEFFSTLEAWEKANRVESYTFLEPDRALSLWFRMANGQRCVLLLQFLNPRVFRVRFNPTKDDPRQYTGQNTRGIVMDTFGALQDELGSLDLTLRELDEGGRRLELYARPKGSDPATTRPALTIIVVFDPFQLTVRAPEDDTTEAVVWQTAPDGLRFSPNGIDCNIVQAFVKPPTAKYIGFGEQGGESLVKNSEQLTTFNFDNMRYRQVYNRGPFEPREPLYHADPFFIEFNGDPRTTRTYGLYVDNPSQVCIDIGYLNSSRCLMGTRFGDLDYYFLLGQDFAEVLSCYTAIVGRPKLKPRYILGYHQGCYGYETRADLEQTVNEYRRFRIPLDGLHIDVDVQKNYETFTIDESKFPNPKEMFTRLRERGVKCSTNITPIISNRDTNYATYAEGLTNNYFVLDEREDPNGDGAWWYQQYGGGQEWWYQFTDPEGRFNSGHPFVGEVYYGGDRGTTGHYADLARKDVRIWWGKQYRYLFDMGLEFVWQDMTTPAIRDTRGDMKGFPFRLRVNSDFLSDVGPSLSAALKVWSIFSYNLHKATYHGLNHLPGRENKRNFIIGRGSFSGMHRFAGLWTGDNCSSWDFLQINVAQVLAVSMCGLAIVGEDIGGFERDADWEHWADPELLMRWTAAGAFLPWFRNHYIRKGVKYFQEPYAYQYVDLNQWNIPQNKRYLYACVLPICKYFIELRYRLMQLFYDAMFENVLTGLPICRPLFLNDPGDRSLFNDKLAFLDNEFFVRRDLLIAPVLEPQSEENGWGKRDVYVPSGSRWYAFVNNQSPLLPSIEGGTTIRDFDASIGADPAHIGFVLPMYVRAGAILPTLELEQYVGERNAAGMPNPITLNVYPGPSGEYHMYLDDGISRSSAPGHMAQFKYNAAEEGARSEYRETIISHRYQDAKTRLILVKRELNRYTPPYETYYYVAVLHDPSEPLGANGPVQSLSVAGAGVPPITQGTPEERAAALAAATGDAWYYNENINITFVKVMDDSPRDSVSIELRYV